MFNRCQLTTTIHKTKYGATPLPNPKRIKIMGMYISEQGMFKSEVSRFEK